MIVVKGSLIEAVGTEREISDSLRKLATLIDLSAYAVLPGLVDAHTHLLSESKIYPNNTDPALA